MPTPSPTLAPLLDLLNDKAPMDLPMALLEPNLRPVSAPLLGMEVLMEPEEPLEQSGLVERHL